MPGTTGWLQHWQRARDGGPRHRPFVTAAFALCRDGYLTAVRGRPTALSSPEALRVTHHLRGQHDAILIGRGTQQSDDPLLTTRVDGGRTGVRVVLDSSLRLSLTSRLVTSHERPVVVFTAPDAPEAAARALRVAGVEVERLPAGPGGLSLLHALEHLARRGLASVMVEGGAAVLESFFALGLVDFVCLTIAPRSVAGPEALPLGPATRAALARWSEAHAFDAGGDHVAVGAIDEAALHEAVE